MPSKLASSQVRILPACRPVTTHRAAASTQGNLGVLPESPLRRRLIMSALRR
jgi:hypothetical protein